MNPNSPPDPIEPLNPVNAAIERNSGLIVLALICALACMYFPAVRHFLTSLVEAAVFFAVAMVVMAATKAAMTAGGA